MASSIPSDFSSIGLKLTQQKAQSVSTLLSGGNCISSMTYDICAAAADSSSISNIAKKVAEVASTAAGAGASVEALENISTFASALKQEGYETLSIITYLGDAGNLAQSDIDAFNQVFSDADDTTTTLIASIEAQSSTE